VVWLLVLFGGELLTIHAMQRYEAQIEKVAILAFFVPLILASGGNTGAQSSTLVIRALALGELRIADWWRVFRRELLIAGALGGLIGAIGLAYVWGGQRFGWIEFAGDAPRFAAAAGGSLVGVMLFGGLLGASLPFLLRLCRLDPATACSPFVATLSDVTGLMIYFTVAMSVLGGI
jgi:magnesium transporter